MEEKKRKRRGRKKEGAKEEGKKERRREKKRERTREMCSMNVFLQLHLRVDSSKRRNKEMTSRTKVWTPSREI